MEFRILGPLEVLDEGRVVALGGSKQRALLALLLLHANETLTPDRLIDELWGEHPPATAAKALQAHVSRLRKVLSADYGAVVTRAHGYELKLDPGCLDARRFEQLVGDGHDALAEGRPEQALSMLEDALGMWRGPPLADLAYEPFAQHEVTRLDELRVAALEQLIEAKLELGGHAELVGQLETLVGEHPYRERLRAQLMLALYRSDRQADALQAYQDARRTLVDQLGIEPGERLRELERAILAQDPALGLAAVPAGAAVWSDSPFVGRAAELAQLAAGLDETFAGRGRVFLLVGEPGIGKSRLADELVTLARTRGARVLIGRCWEAGGAPAYWPWVQSLREYVRDSDPAALRAELGPGATDVAQILPELYQQFPDLSEPAPIEPEAARFRLFDATTEFVRRAAQTRPIVLVLDDLHAADAPSLLLLRFLVRQVRSSRILVLGAYRDVDPAPRAALAEMVAEVAREPATRRLPLTGLSEREVEEYVELTASDVIAPGFAAALHEEAAGNPLFVGEIVRLIAVEGVGSGSAAALRQAIPESVRDVIGRRLAHLTQECNRVLLLAAVLGREFSLDALAHMGGVTEDRLLELLDEAMAARVVSDVPGLPGRLRFAHVLIRDTLYGALTTARRVRLHRLAVEALERLYGSEPGAHLAELAHHAVAGSEFDKGLHFARRAGDRALALFAHEESARLYQTALEALELSGRPDEPTRCGLLLSLGEAELRVGDTPAAKEAFLGAAGIARRLGLPRELARAAAGYGGRFMWARPAGDDRLVPLLEEGLGALGDGDVELRARLLARLSGALRDEQSRDRRDRLSSEAVALARAEGDPVALAFALDGRAAAISAPDTIAEGLTLAAELHDVAEKVGDIERLANAFDHRRTALVMAGDLAGAEADLAAESRIADDLKQPFQLWQVCSARAMLALAYGDLALAEELVTRALSLGQPVYPAVAVPVYRLQWHTLCDFHDRVDDAASALRDSVAEYPTRPIFRCALAYLDARCGRLAEAQRAIDTLGRDEFSAIPFDQEWLYSTSLLAEACALLGDTRAATALYSLLSPWAALCAGDHPEGIRGSVARYLGLLATTLNRWDDAERHFEHAVATNARIGVRPWLAHTTRDYACMLTARGRSGDRARARELLDAADAGYRELGMKRSAATAG